jgi:hypothetical protein
LPVLTGEPTAWLWSPGRRCYQWVNGPGSSGAPVPVFAAHRHFPTQALSAAAVARHPRHDGTVVFGVGRMERLEAACGSGRQAS